MGLYVYLWAGEFVLFDWNYRETEGVTLVTKIRVLHVGTWKCELQKCNNVNVQKGLW